MKLLIVDDSPSRLNGLLGSIVERAGIARDSIDVVGSAYAAKSKLKANAYDLMILDVLLPEREEGVPDASVSMSLLDDICESDLYFRPNHIIGITAFSEIEISHQEAFSGRLWRLIRSAPDSDDWISRIVNAIRYLVRTPEDRDFGANVDVCVLTALGSPEMDAVYALPWNWSTEEPLDNTMFFSKGCVNGEVNRLAVGVILPRPGMVFSAVYAARVIERFRPRVLVMPGICAGISGRVKIGDILIADPVWDCQSGKYEDNGSFSFDPHQIPMESKSRTLVDSFARSFNATSIFGRDQISSENAGKIVVGPMASTSSVVSNDQRVKAIVAQHRKTIGFEMELFGLYAAASYSPYEFPIYFGVKCVADYGERKSDDFQHCAARRSALVMSELLKVI